MDKIKHKFVEVNGLKHHVAEIGDESSPAVLFLHGFPEIWYTWRYQMIGLAEAGFRAIAPDFRGFGLSEPGALPETTTFLDLYNDTVGILDYFNISKVFVVGKDFGSYFVYALALLEKERVLGVVSFGMPLYLPGEILDLTALPEGFYITRWIEPGRAEADFRRFDATTVVRKLYILFSRSEVPIANENQEILDLVDSSAPLPYWFTEKDLAIYGSLYTKSGFATALEIPYRSLDEERFEFNTEDPRIAARTLLIAGEKDYYINIPGVRDLIDGEEIREYIPKLEVLYLPDGSHFIPEQFPDQTNKLLINFFTK